MSLHGADAGADLGVDDPAAVTREEALLLSVTPELLTYRDAMTRSRRGWNNGAVAESGVVASACGMNTARGARSPRERLAQATLCKAAVGDALKPWNR